MSEPEQPATNDGHAFEATPLELINEVCRRTYLGLSAGNNQYHRNLRHILNQIHPGHALEEQMRRTWITRYLLCSTPSADDIPVAALRECRESFLDRQLELFASARVVALGLAAQKRLKGHPGLLECADPAPPGCHQPGARESWSALGKSL